jgi:1,4-alpha-glucan branching enzyme
MLTPEQIERLAQGREDDPFATLGVHPADQGFTACVMLPEALSVRA